MFAASSTGPQLLLATLRSDAVPNLFMSVMNLSPDDAETWKAEAKRRASQDLRSFLIQSHLYVCGAGGLLWLVDGKSSLLLAVVCSLFVVSGFVGVVIYWLSERLSFLQWRLEVLEWNLEQSAVARRSYILEAPTADIAKVDPLTEELDRARLEALDAELRGLGFTASEAIERRVEEKRQ